MYKKAKAIEKEMDNILLEITSKDCVESKELFMEKFGCLMSLNHCQIPLAKQETIRNMEIYNAKLFNRKHINVIFNVFEMNTFSTEDIEKARELLKSEYKDLEELGLVVDKNIVLFRNLAYSLFN